MAITESRQPLPIVVYAVAITVSLTYTSRGPTTYLVNHVGRALYGPQAVFKRVSEGVDDTSLSHRCLSHLLMAAEAELAFDKRIPLSCIRAISHLMS